MPFECSQCGECCSHLGLVHTIREAYGNYRYLVYNQYTGEKTPVEVDLDKIALFEDRRIFTERPEACPFFRYDRHGAKGYCTASEDERLTRLFESQVNAIAEADDAAWDERLKRVLVAAGYTLRE
jgi:hypothetical protein